MPLKDILRAQCAWADDAGRSRTGHLCESIDDNLFAPLRAVTRAEFAAASGDELGLSGKTPKMRSLRSSSALAVNTFDAWRGLDLTSLNSALGMNGRLTDFHFEQRLPHGLASSPPTLDLLLFRDQEPPIGIEVKFCELYDSTKEHLPIDDKYFVGDRARWSEVGLRKCQLLASSIGRSESFRRLGAGQLLKHILGLSHVFGTDEGVHLIYLWFDSACQEADEHRDEIARFGARLDSRVDFRPVTYQEFLLRLQAFSEPTPGYLNYLQQRYGAI